MQHTFSLSDRFPRSCASTFRLIDVSDENLSKLFPSDTESAAATMSASLDVLDKVKHLHPLTAECLYVTEDENDKAPFRLLCADNSHTDCPSNQSIFSFVALSYCWHGSQWQVRTGDRSKAP